MKKFFLIAAAAMFASCASLFGSQSYEDPLNKVQLGMTEQEVTALMGTDYRVVGMGSTPRGDMRTISYSYYQRLTNETLDTRTYKSVEKFFDFTNGRLTSFHREEYNNPTYNNPAHNNPAHN